MGIFLIILLLICLFWPWISKWVGRWVQGFMARRFEDMTRRMMGMPSRKEERRRNRNSETNGGNGRRRDARRRHRRPTENAADIMKTVAEDVEFTEVREFESTTITEETISGGTRTRRVYREEQVSDAEFVEIKGSDRDK